jgi:hypothetical protein
MIGASPSVECPYYASPEGVVLATLAQVTPPFDITARAIA